ncbi:TIGR02281 family clan AA aspartic protease [Vampirovibrio chlorellavorus]|uniref:TIGR02281 family clan AA aspartic protease n=1 Tax=Vampirovibrio chlorellavorus TaxID=758823 RepID=UPI0026EADF4D|nr:TIGR02281 family clan AA aspartic protease [Vampirovibrio chlorellavorus]
MGSASLLRVTKGLPTAALCCLMAWALAVQAEPYAESNKDRAATTGGYLLPDYARGVQAFRSGDYHRAEDYFRRALQADSSNANAHYYLGLTLDKLGHLSEALYEYEFVIRQGREARLVHYAHERVNALAAAISVQESSRTAPSPTLQSVSYAPVTTSAFQQVSSPLQEPIKVLLKDTHNALIVDAVLYEGRQQSSGAFIIDTGATYTSISQQMAEQLGLNLANCEKVLITTANGRIEVPKITIERLQVNGLEARNVEATVIPVRAGSSFSGLLGLSFMRQFVVTIDPQAGHLIFQQNRLF